MTVIAAEELASTTIETDVAIVGAGAAGLVLAADLNVPTVVIESGTDDVELFRQWRYGAIVSGEPTFLEGVRIRAIGGSTTRWTGRCIELDPYDFEHRPWIAEHGWPIPFSELREAYDRAWRSLNIERLDSAQVFDRTRLSNWLGNGAALEPCLWQYSYRGRQKYLRFGTEYRPYFSGETRHLLYAADCVEIQTEGREVKALKVVDRNGRSILVKAKRFVLASGCIEACRLLQITARSSPETLHEVEPWLGRGFMQHLRVDGGELATTRAQFRTLQRAANRFPRPNCGSHETGFSISADHAREARLGNASLILQFKPDWNQADMSVVPAVLGRARGREAIFPAGTARLELDAEQAVTRESRVGLSEERDLHGMPRAEVHWTIAEVDRVTVVRAMEWFAAFLKEHDLGELPWPEGVATGMIAQERVKDSNHHLGGTRMSETGATGVVDRNLKVHGTANLWVVGGSVFSTGGHANPTLTIVALAHRLAEHLSQA